MTSSPQTPPPERSRKRMGISALTIIAIVVLLAPIIPVQYKVQKETTVTGTVTQTRTILDTISQTSMIPRVTTTRVIAIDSETYEERTTWQVTWYTLTGEGRFGASVGTQTFPATFNYDWRRERVYQAYSDFVAFKATSTINVQRSRPVTFSIISDDGVRLFVDGEKVIDKWERPLFNPHQESKVVNLTPGKHILELEWYEWEGNARISFDIDPDVVEWEQTRTVTRTQTQIITTTITSIVVQTSTSYSTYTTLTVTPKTETIDQVDYVSILQLLIRR